MKKRFVLFIAVVLMLIPGVILLAGGGRKKQVVQRERQPLPSGTLLRRLMEKYYEK